MIQMCFNLRSATHVVSVPIQSSVQYQNLKETIIKYYSTHRPNTVHLRSKNLHFDWNFLNRNIMEIRKHEFSHFFTPRRLNYNFTKGTKWLWYLKLFYANSILNNLFGHVLWFLEKILGIYFHQTFSLREV